MPPSGFSDEAIAGLLEFVKSSYESILNLNRYKDKNVLEKETLDSRIKYLNAIIKNSVQPISDCTVSPDGINGLCRFIVINYKDLVKEIQDGKKDEAEAIQLEIERIRKYLVNFKLRELHKK